MGELFKRTELEGRVIQTGLTWKCQCRFISHCVRQSVPAMAPHLQSKGTQAADLVFKDFVTISGFSCTELRN